MKRRLWATALLIGAFIALGRSGAVARDTRDRLWYAPGPGTLDLIRMFEHPEEWARARSLMSVFKFYQQHTFANPAPLTGPNTYQALSRAGAFAKLTRWHLKIALEVGAVKDYYCEPTAAGMARSSSDTVDAVRAVNAAGGLVQYLAMDEPFLAGQARACGGPALEPTADRLRLYFDGVRRTYPLVRIGLIEAYPSFTPSDFGAMLQLMKARGIPPAFVHVDVDIRGLRPARNDLNADIRRIQELCQAESIPFGVIIWGYNGDADALFALDAATLATAFRSVFSGGHQPDQIVFQSWAESSTGLRITPSNLPEGRPYTLTNLLTQEFRRFAGEIENTHEKARRRQ